MGTGENSRVVETFARVGLTSNPSRGPNRAVALLLQGGRDCSLAVRPCPPVAVRREVDHAPAQTVLEAPPVEANQSVIRLRPLEGPERVECARIAVRHQRVRLLVTVEPLRIGRLGLEGLPRLDGLALARQL